MNNDELDLTDAQLLRQKAEEKLKAENNGNTPVNETDVKRLLHELQVHQIELEMQNEELRQAYETAETALRKYTILYDFAPMGYFTLGQNGTIEDLNFTAAEILGEKRIGLLNSNFKLYIAEESLSKFNNFFDRVYKTNAKESCQIMLGYDEKPLCPAYLEGIVLEDNQKCFLSVLDISEFKK